MSLYVCSLINNAPQVIPADGDYHLLRFPFGDEESYDAHAMHQVAQPDGHRVDDWPTDDRSGLIWPKLDGWATVTAMIYWKDGAYTQLRDRLVRDPMGLFDAPDSTCTEDRALTVGAQAFHKTHELFVHPGVPLGVEVKVSGPRPETVYHAQFKLAVESDVAKS